MSTFLETLRSGRVLLMDGAMGTELQRAGLKPGENAATWNVRHPDRVRRVHDAYRAAGAEVLLTNTFQGDRTALMDIAGHGAWVLGDIGPMVRPGAYIEFVDLAELAKTANVMRKTDAILLETISSPRVRFATRRIRNDALLPPVLLSLTYFHDKRGRQKTFSGHSPEWFAERAEHWGAAALGVNCGREITMADCAEIVRRYRKVTDLPLFARPNAGTPRKVRKRWIYPLTPHEMAERLPELLEAGVSMVGGCCGTTPEHIAAIRSVVERWNTRHAGNPARTIARN